MIDRKVIVGGAAAGAILLIIIIVALTGEPNISGRYTVKVNGKSTKTTAEVTRRGDRYELELTGIEGLHARYPMERTERGEYLAQDSSGGNRSVEYRLRSTGSKLEGIVTVLPVGTMKIVLERTRSN